MPRQDTIVNIYGQHYEWCMDFATKVRRKRSDEEKRTTRYSDGLQAHKVGALAEFAYFIIIGKDPYEEMVITDDPDPGWDDILFGKKVQVKGTRFSGIPAALMVEDQYLWTSDFVVGMAVDGNTVRSLGYETSKEFKRKSEVDEHIAPNTGCGSVWEKDLINIHYLPFHCRFGDRWLNAMRAISNNG